MKLWKKFTSLVLTFVMVLPFTLGTTGCKLTGDPVADAQTIADAAVILRGTARGAATIAIQENANNVAYVRLAVQVLDQFLVGDEYTPGALTDALEPVLKEAKDLKVKLAINTATDLYEIFYGRYVRGQFKSKETAFKLVRALRDGAAQALPTP